MWCPDGGAPGDGTVVCTSVADGALLRVDLGTGTSSVVATVGGGANAAYPASDGGFVVTQNGGIDFTRAGIYGDDPAAVPARDARAPARRRGRRRELPPRRPSTRSTAASSHPTTSSRPRRARCTSRIRPSTRRRPSRRRPGPRARPRRHRADGRDRASTTATASASSPTAGSSWSRSRGWPGSVPTAPPSGSSNSSPTARATASASTSTAASTSRRPAPTGSSSSSPTAGRSTSCRSGARHHHQLLLRRRRRPDAVRHGRHPRPARRLGGAPDAGPAAAPVARGLTPRYRRPIHPAERTGVSMRAAIFVENDQPLVVEDVTPNAPGARDVVVRITASGVCHSDLSVINGTLPMPPPAILGHEGAGDRRLGRRGGPGPERRRPCDRLVHPGVRPLLVLHARPVEPLREHLHGHDDTRARPAATARRSRP